MERIEYLDRAKALGMFLVYYGHFAERLAQNHYVSALMQMKFIYSFHMPLFFFIAGMFWKPVSDVRSVFVRKIQTRIIPVMFWGIALIPLWLTVVPTSEILNKITNYGFGFPTLNGVTWFLVCLFSLEMIASLIYKRFLLDWRKAIAVSTVSFLLGFFLIIPAGVNWYIGEALVVMSFYLAGYSLKSFLIKDIGLRWAMLFFTIFGSILFLTFDLNKGPFLPQFPMVLLSLLSHGNPWYFLFTAFAGIFATLALTILLKIAHQPFRFISENLLIFLGLNGICFHFLNQYIVLRVGWIPDTGPAVFLLSLIYTVTIILLFSPIVIALRRWIPELVGYPWEPHSLLPPFDGWFSNHLRESVELD